MSHLQLKVLDGLKTNKGKSFTLRGFADHFGVEPRTVQRHAKNGLIPGVFQSGKRQRIRRCKESIQYGSGLAAESERRAGFKKTMIRIGEKMPAFIASIKKAYNSVMIEATAEHFNSPSFTHQEAQLELFLHHKGRNDITLEMLESGEGLPPDIAAAMQLPVYVANYQETIITLEERAELHRDPDKFAARVAVLRLSDAHKTATPSRIAKRLGSSISDKIRNVSSLSVAENPELSLTFEPSTWPDIYSGDSQEEMELDSANPYLKSLGIV